LRVTVAVHVVGFPGTTVWGEQIAAVDVARLDGGVTLTTADPLLAR
jgi:hypothetical protein